ncbi:hypothetical protein ACIF80_19035 [Streptomyces sp. NPDC085927]|uniref:hypothetical protein n=1 Tax=Streptomyces sp. NPDC085927 TaxID=3365738 RepID=UPI0037D3DD25
MKRVSKAVGLSLLVAAGVLGYGLLLWKGPWIFDGSHVRKRDLQPADGVVITGFRTMVIAIGAGIIAAVGLLYTHRNHKLAQVQFEHTQEQFTLAQEQFRLAQEQFKQSQDQFTYEQEKDRTAAKGELEARATEQYVTAIRLLASANPTERIGGIYSLQRIANDSDRDRPAIRMMLETFVRNRKEVIDEERFGDKPIPASELSYGNDHDVALETLKRLAM